jgi:arsenite/tail-anchored protein-transporting ATPase
MRPPRRGSCSGSVKFVSGANGSVVDLLGALPRWVIVGGKGGVGKTTIAIALATHAPGRVLLLSTDPAQALRPALGEPVGPRPTALRSHPNVFAQQLDAVVERDAFLARWRETLVTVIDRGTYLDRGDIVGLIDAVLPGTDEAMALLSLADLAASSEWDRIIIDTAPTGHTLRLLALPQTFRLVVDLLELMQDKHRFMVRALTHRYRTDAVDAMLVELRQRVDALRRLLSDPAATRLVLVARAEPVVVAETVRYVDALPGLGLALGAVVINAVAAGADRNALAALASLAPGVPHVTVARWDAAEVTPATMAGPRAALPMRRLTIVGGKGGVGKTTVACALALDVAAESRPTLLVSTDPAPSIADAIETTVGDEAVAIAPGLWARQADASTAFAAMQRGYRERVDAVFDRLIGAGLDVAHDRRILQELLALAPPGIDELYALAMIGETLAEGRYHTVIVDPAPTGHLLRLLETPAIALDWSHRIMRLALKYKEVGSLTDTVGDILTFAKRTRAVQGLLADAESATVILVALDEPLVRSEAERLATAVTGLGLSVGAVIWNRVGESRPHPLSTPAPAPQFAAPVESPSPRGLDALRAWRSRWTPLG